MTVDEHPPSEHPPQLEQGGTEADRALEQVELAQVMGSPLQSAIRIGLLAAAIAALGLWRGLPIVVVVVALLVMIFLHELGHYLAARRAGMKATEFFIGFGPRIWSFRRGETEFGVKAIPAGAYVKILGMNNLEEVDPADEPRTYRQAPFRSRISVAVAGSAMHFAVAIILLVVQLAWIGWPSDTKWEIGAVTKGSAAAAAGLRQGDQILSFGERAVGDYDEFRSAIGHAPAGETELVVLRGGQRRTIDVDLSRRTKVIGTIGEDVDLITSGEGVVVGAIPTSGQSAAAGLRTGDRVTDINGVEISGIDDVAAAVKRSGDGTVAVTTVHDGTTATHEVDLGRAVATTAPAAFLGVGQQSVLETRSIPGAVGSSFAEFGRMVGASVGGLGRVLWPTNLVDFLSSTVTDSPKDTATTPTPAADAPATTTERPVSIIGIVALGDEMTSQSWSQLIGFLITINIVLGVFNMIPLLPFDGGHVAIAVYEKAQEMRRGQRRRYVADVTRMLPVAYGVIMVLVIISFAAMYVDVTKGVGT